MLSKIQKGFAGSIKALGPTRWSVFSSAFAVHFLGLAWLSLSLGGSITSHMGALSFIKQMIGQKSSVATDALAELALAPARNEEFLRTLVQSYVWIMGQGKAMETDTPTQEQALEHVRRGMEQFAAVDSAEQIQIYIHTVEDQPILPFFSSADFMQGFVQTLRLDHITCYEGLSVPFAYLLNPEFAKNHLFLNPNTKAQRHITVADRRKLLELATQA